jgi:hypothetical protein
MAAAAAGAISNCPSTHPKVIPTFTMGVWYTTDADLDRSGTWDASRPTCHLPSDVMPDVPMGRDPRIITNRLEIVTMAFACQLIALLFRSLVTCDRRSHSSI